MCRVHYYSFGLRRRRPSPGLRADADRRRGWTALSGVVGEVSIRHQGWRGPTPTGGGDVRMWYRCWLPQEQHPWLRHWTGTARSDNGGRRRGCCSSGNQQSGTAGDAVGIFIVCRNHTYAFQCAARMDMDVRIRTRRWENHDTLFCALSRRRRSCDHIRGLFRTMSGIVRTVGELPYAYLRCELWGGSRTSCDWFISW